MLNASRPINKADCRLGFWVRLPLLSRRILQPRIKLLCGQFLFVHFVVALRASATRLPQPAICVPPNPKRLMERLIAGSALDIPKYVRRIVPTAVIGVWRYALLHLCPFPLVCWDTDTIIIGLRLVATSHPAPLEIAPTTEPVTFRSNDKGRTPLDAPLGCLQAAPVNTPEYRRLHQRLRFYCRLHVSAFK